MERRGAILFLGWTVWGLVTACKNTQALGPTESIRLRATQNATATHFPVPSRFTVKDGVYAGRGITVYGKFTMTEPIDGQTEYWFGVVDGGNRIFLPPSRLSPE
jgi:hypothetical protein